MLLKPNKRVRNYISLDRKKEIIQIREQGFSHQKIANIFGIGRSTVSKIINQRSKIIQSYEVKKQFKSSHAESTLEDHLLLWYTQVSSKAKKLQSKSTLNRHDVLEKAQQLIKQLDLKNIIAGPSWIDYFFIKHNLKIQIDESRNLADNNTDKQQLLCNNIVRSNVPDNLFFPISSQIQLEKDFNSHFISYYNSLVYDSLALEYSNVINSSSSSYLYNSNEFNTNGYDNNTSNYIPYSSKGLFIDHH
ncbi:hypothetical protein K502DRAFT_351691 [Neoconidiobolus thromboides FSU 785]|nr:hypothetical protein K502DRAFT_351691 [Neoconidiobolus thromboides FSU 785]